MTDSLLLDTHIVLWLDSGDSHLRPATRALIDRCWSAGGTLYVSAVTVWEIALLVDTGRISLDLPPLAWVERFVSPAGVEVVSLSWQAAAGTYDWPALFQRDPADRMLIATAIELNCPLLTADEQITAFSAQSGRQYGLAVAEG